MVESLVDTSTTAENLNQQHTHIQTLIQNFETAISQLSETDRSNNNDLISELRVKMESMRLVVQNAYENKLIYDEGENTVSNETNWNDISHEHFINSIDVTDHGEKMDIVDESNETLSPTADCPIESKDGEKLLQSKKKEASSEMLSETVDQSGNDQQSKENDKSKENISRDNLSNALTAAMNNTDGFTYTSLIMYSTAVNELKSIKSLPEQATSANIRELRNFISAFVTLCQEMRIGFHYLEPMLLTQIIDAFNASLHSNWKFFMQRNKASIATMREFLATQEEMASEDWERSGRLVMSRAIRAAQQQLRSTPPIGKTTNGAKTTQESKVHQKAPVEKNPFEKSNEERKSRETSKSTYAKVVSDQAQPGCSNWEIPSRPPVVSTGQPRTPRPSSMDTLRKNDRERISESSDSKKSEKKKGAKAKEKKQKAWVCLGCKKSGHPLFFCKRFLSLPFNERWRLVKEKGICQLCLCEQHSIMECQDGDCGQCSEPHNSTLCAISIEKKKNGPKEPKRKDDENWED